MKIMTEFGLVEDFAQLLCVDDTTLEMIRQDPELVNKAEFVINLIDTDGNNAVIVRLELRKRHDIIKYASELLLSFDSVSWIRDGKLFTRRNR